MIPTPTRWTRRQFSQTIAAAAASSLLPSSAFAAPPTQPEAIAFVASLGSAPSQPAAIHVFRVAPAGWTELQVLPAPQPAHLELHPTLPVLYAVHALPLWNNLPRGAVSAYDISPAGQLTLRHTLPLSLAATTPRHAAISPDGTRLVVAATGAGIYNVLRIASDGSLEAVTGIRKECGIGDESGRDLSAPQYVLFHPDGQHLLASDSGQSSLTLFTVQDDDLRLQHRIHTETALSRITLSSCANWIRAEYPNPTQVSLYRLEDQQIRALRRSEYLSQAKLPADARLHIIATATEEGIAPFQTGPLNAELRPSSGAPHNPLLRLLAFTPCGTHLIAIRNACGDLVQIPFLTPPGELGRPQTVARLPATSCIRLIRA